MGFGHRSYRARRHDSVTSLNTWLRATSGCTAKLHSKLSAFATIRRIGRRTRPMFVALFCLSINNLLRRQTLQDALLLLGSEKPAKHIYLKFTKRKKIIYFTKKILEHTVRSEVVRQWEGLFKYKDQFEYYCRANESMIGKETLTYIVVEQFCRRITVRSRLTMQRKRTTVWYTTNDVRKSV